MRACRYLHRAAHCGDGGFVRSAGKGGTCTAGFAPGLCSDKRGFNCVKFPEAIRTIHLP